MLSRAAFTLSLTAALAGCLAGPLDPIELVRHDVRPDLERPELAVLPDGTLQQRYIVLVRDDLFADGLLNDTVVDLVLSEDVALEHMYGTVLPGFAAPLSDVQVRALRARPEVALVTEDRPVQAVKGPPGGGGTTGPARDWALGDVLAANWTGDLANTTDGTGASVAVLDTGIDGDHAYLPAATCLGNFTGGSGCQDGEGHGTHVSGTIAALPSSGHRGIAPGVALNAAKVLNDQGSGSYSGIVAGIDAAADARIGVLNMSLGGSALAADGTLIAESADVLCMAITSAKAGGTTTVVAAGNESADSALSTPARCDDAITVAAYDSNGKLSYFSNWGADVDIAAPGSTIYSTVAYNASRRNAAMFGAKSGTSMASPHVAAVVALAQAANPTATPDELKALLLANSADRGEPTDYSSTVQLSGVSKLDGRDY